MSASPRANRVTCHGLPQASRGILNQGSCGTLHWRVRPLPGFCPIPCRGLARTRAGISETPDRLLFLCPSSGIPEDAQGSPGFQETLARSFTMPLVQEATVGFEPTHRGFAGPDSGDLDPCSPFAGFRVRVLVFRAAWRDETLDRHLGPGNRHNRCRRVFDVTPYLTV